MCLKKNPKISPHCQLFSFTSNFSIIEEREKFIYLDYVCSTTQPCHPLSRPTKFFSNSVLRLIHIKLRTESKGQNKKIKAQSGKNPKILKSFDLMLFNVSCWLNMCYKVSIRDLGC